MGLPTLLLETNDTIVHFCDAGSDFVVLSISPLGFYGETPLSRIWGQHLFQKNSISVIGVTARWPHWFPEPDFQKYGNHLRRFIKNLGLPCLAYGHSMGAYAALKYGAALGIDATLAFSPQCSINPIDVGTFEKRFASFFDLQLHSKMAVSSSDLCPVNLVVFDPDCSEDRLHWQKISSFYGMFGVVAPGTQHMTVDLVTHSEVALAMFRIALSSSIDRSMSLRRLLKEQRHRTPNYWFNTFVALGKHGKSSWANTIWESLKDQGFTTLRLQIEVARQAFRNRNTSEALRILNEIELNEKVGLQDFIEMRRIYAEADQISSAMKVATEIARRYPEHTDSWLILAFYHQLLGHKPFAQAAMLRALEGESQDPTLWVRLRDALTAIGLPHKAVVAAEKAQRINPKHGA